MAGYNKFEMFVRSTANLNDFVVDVCFLPLAVDPVFFGISRIERLDVKI